MAGGLGGLGGFDFGNVLGAIGQSLLTSPRENPFQGLPQALQNNAKLREHQAALQAMSTVAEKLGVPKELAASPEAMKLFIDHINATKLNQLRQQAAQGTSLVPPGDDDAASQPAMSVPGLQGSSGIPTTFNVAGGGVPGGLDGPGGLGGPVAEATAKLRTRPGGLGATPKLPTFAAIQGGTPSGKIAGIISQAADRYGVDPTALVRTAQIESSLNPNAKNPSSSAGGLFQFINSTAKQYGLTNKFDPVASADAGARLMRDNADKLRGVLGRDPQPWELYLAHQQGSGGAAKLLSNPNASAASLVGADAVRLNGGSPGMTAQQFAGIWRKRFGDLPSASQNATGLVAAASGATPDYARADAQRLAMGGTLGGGAMAGGGVPLPPVRPTQLASADPNMPLPSPAMQRVMDEAVTKGVGQNAGQNAGQNGPGIGQSGAPLNQVAAGRSRALTVPIPPQTSIPATQPPPATPPPTGTGGNKTKAWARAEFQRGMNILATSNGDPVLMKQAEVIMQSARKYLEPSEAARRVAEAGLTNTPAGRATIAGLPATAIEQLTEQLIPGYVSPSTLEQKKYQSAEDERAYQHSKGERVFLSAEDERKYRREYDERRLANEIANQALAHNRAEAARRQQRDIATESHDIARQSPAEKVGGGLNDPRRAPNVREGLAAETTQKAAEMGATTTAKSQATAQSTLPTAEAATSSALEAIREIRNHPGRKWATGGTAIFSPYDIARPGGPTADFIALTKTLKGQLFRNAYETLKGEHGITDVEGEKATQAILNLDRTQSEEQFLKNLDTAEGILQKGLDTTRAKAGAPQQTPKMSSGDIAQSLANARAAIVRNPAARDAIAERLRAAGIDPRGL